MLTGLGSGLQEAIALGSEQSRHTLRIKWDRVTWQRAPSRRVMWRVGSGRGLGGVPVASIAIDSNWSCEEKKRGRRLFVRTLCFRVTLFDAERGEPVTKSDDTLVATSATAAGAADSVS